MVHLSFLFDKKKRERTAQLVVEESRGAGLARDVDDLVVVVEAVELGRAALGVGAHVLEVEPVPDVQEARELDALGDEVDAVAGRAPDGVVDALGRGLGPGLGVGRARGRWHRGIHAGQDLRDGVLVVEDDVGEVAVDTIVQVQHVRVARGVLGIGHVAAGDDVGSQGEGAGNIEATRLRDDADVRREVSVEGLAEDTSELLEGLIAEAAADIQSVQLVAHLGGLVKDDTGILDGLEEGLGVLRAGAHVEADPDDLELELTGELEEGPGHVQGCTELHAQSAETGRVVRQDPQIQLCVGEIGLDLVQLIGIVESHLLDALLSRVADEGLGLARLGVDDAARVDARLQGQVDLRLGSAVEAVSKLGHEAKDLRVRVALDRCKVQSAPDTTLPAWPETRPTVEGLDAAQVHLPAQVLAVDLAHVRDEESIFLPSTTAVDVDAGHTLLEDLKDQVLGGQLGLEEIVRAIVGVQTVFMFAITTILVLVILGHVNFSRREGRRCHNHAAGGAAHDALSTQKHSEIETQEGISQRTRPRVLGRTILLATVVDWT